MFTGIVETNLPVAAVEKHAEGLDFELELGTVFSELNLGESIAVDGCCLTIAALDGGKARFQAGRETLSLTTLDEIAVGRPVNVERALAFGDRLGGHLVSGHVDGVGRVTSIVEEPSQTVMSFELPERLAGEVILKGSVALDGVSLTITEVSGPVISVALIPHTLEVTTLGVREVGQRINVETDMIGKWIVQQTGPLLEEIERRAASRGGEKA